MSPTCEQTLRALARYPARTAFGWPGGSLSYQGTLDLIGRIQSVFMRLGLQPGTRVAFLSANRADSWCAGVAAQLARLAITWLHPLGSLEDQLFQLEDSEAADAGGGRGYLPRPRRRARGQGKRPEDASSRSARPITAPTCSPRSRTPARASARCLAGADDIAMLNYTGGTTGKSKGALRHHREDGGFANAILADFEIPERRAI